MTAPALVLLSPGSHDPRVASVAHELRDQVLAIRPELDVSVAFLDHCPPSGLQAVHQLVKREVSEVVLVPMLLSEAFPASAEVAALAAQLQAAQPQLRVITSRPVGPESSLLSVLDRRLRDALRARRVSELDGLVFAAAGSADVRSNALVARRARQWSAHHRLPCVTAFGSASGPSTAEAIRTLCGQGRRHIAVGSWFLTPGLRYSRQLELAQEAGAIAVSAPLGPEPEIAQTALARYVVSAMELVDLDGDAESEAEAPIRHLSVVGA
ncbi:MAG: sirohydrochlorin chelatase [Actinomycetes bacterium]